MKPANGPVFFIEITTCQRPLRDGQIIMGGPFLYMKPCLGLAAHHEQRVFEEKEGI